MAHTIDFSADLEVSFTVEDKEVELTEVLYRGEASLPIKHLPLLLYNDIIEKINENLVDYVSEGDAE